jgi:metal-sulfur cluster biosynthetic enzyme
MIVEDIKLLRADLIKCRKLPCYRGCEYKEQFKNVVNQALKEIYQEWDIK